MQQVALALLWSARDLLLQLRDFDPGIADPGQWGLFGGHVEAHEAPRVALARELKEELGLGSVDLSFLGEVVFADQQRRIFAFSAGVDHPMNTLILSEGQEIGQFSVEAIRRGELYSRHWNRAFQVTAITTTLVERWPSRG